MFTAAKLVSFASKYSPFLNRKLEALKASNGRNQKIAVNIAFSILARASSLLLLVVPIPVMMKHLGMERFGVYSTIMGMVGVMMFADLGLGLGLQNSMAKSQYQPDPELEMKKNVSTTFFTLLMISVILSIAVFTSLFFIDLPGFLNFRIKGYSQEIDFTVYLAFILFFFSIPLSIVQKIHAGLQKNFINSVWQLIGNTLSLILIFVFARLNLGLPYFLFATFGISACMTVANFIYFFSVVKPELTPHPKYFSLQEVKPLFKIGLIFFVLQILQIVGVSSDPIIISKYLGPYSVALYAIGFRIYQLMIVPMQILTEPVLPAFNEALYANDYKWIMRTFKKLLIVAVVWAGLCILFNCIAGQQLIHLWIKGAAPLPDEILLAFSIFILQGTLGCVFGSILSSNHFIKIFLILFTIANAVSVSFKFLLIKKFQIPGVLYITIASYILLIFLPAAIYLFRYFSHTKEKINTAKV